MSDNNIILDRLNTPTPEAIENNFIENIRGLWQDLNQFIQSRYQATPRMEYSGCYLQKGWNIKYKKAGKSLCTLYPAEDHFYILIVIKTEIAEMIKSISDKFEPAIIELIESARPLNGTYWLMIKVDSKAILDDVKELLLIKNPPKN